MPRDEVISTDVLVVGGGAAGCRAAIEAINRGVKTILVTKGLVTRSGCTSHSTGAVSAVGPWSDPEDSVEQYMADAIKGGEYMADQELAKVLYSELSERVMELEKYGGYWTKNDDDGKLVMWKEGGHSFPRTFGMNYPYSGKNIMKTLKAELLRLHANIIEETMVTNLLVNEGNVVGATALDYLNGLFKIFRAKSTILCTGHHDQIFPYSTVGRESTGDGVAMAYRAGAELIDMENHLILGAKLSYHPSMYMPIYTGRLFKLLRPGVKYLNAKEEEYYADYIRAYAPPGIAPKTLTMLAMLKEVNEGRGTPAGCVYLSLRHIQNLKKILEDAKVNIVFEKAGIDPTKELIEVGFGCHANSGGIRVNTHGETTVPGLYAAGGTAGPYYGFQRVVGFGIGLALVFGKRAGEYAALHASKMELPEIDWGQVDKERDNTYSFLKQAGGEGVSPTVVKNMIQWNNWKHFVPVKREAGLKEALIEIERIRREEIPRMSLKTSTSHFNYEWVEALEIPNMLLISEIKMKAALMRKESRGPYVRMDYLARNDKEWLKHILVKRVNGKMKFYTEPVKFTYVKPEPK